MRHWRSYVLLLGVCCGACGVLPEEQGPPSLRAAEDLEGALSSARVQQSPEQALIDLERALRLYSLVDDRAGQVRIHVKLARLYYRLGQREKAILHLDRALDVSSRLGDARQLYDVYLLDGRLRDRRESYERALEFANGPIQKAVALSYLGRTQEAYRLVQGHSRQAKEAPDDAAFVVYEHARSSGDPAVAEQALALYKHADNHGGIADALYLTGQLHRRNGDLGQYRDYLERALTVSRALGDETRTRAIKAELADL